MKYDFILAFDPSGNFNEGKGTTGWCVFNALDKRITFAGHIPARHYQSMEGYWQAHVTLIKKFQERYGQRLVVVIEDYFLYKSRADSQINSKFETSKLIGVMQYHCFIHNLPYIMQPASEVKPRWEVKTLVFKGYIKQKGRCYYLPTPANTEEPINEHCMDSIKHAVHFATFKNKEEQNADTPK